MIRDPSDGSVREKPSKEINLPINETSGLTPETCSKGIMVSGLQTGSSRPGEIERLEKSREWIRNRKLVQSRAEVAGAGCDHPLGEITASDGGRGGET